MNAFSMFQPTTVRRNLKIMALVSSWLVRLLSASVEVYLRKNFGRRYFLMLFLGFLFTGLCFTSAASVLSSLFLLGQFAMILWHAVFAYNHRSFPPVHSLSSGESWPYWQRVGLHAGIVRCFGEPIICVLIGLLLRLIDQPVGIWLEISGCALFVKESLAKIQATWRILDATDAKLDAQQLNAGLNSYANPANAGAQRPHRAQFPHHMNHQPP